MATNAAPPRPEMVAAVDAALKELERIAPDPALVGACPELPGIVLDRVVGAVISHQDARYHETVREYNLMRSEYLKAMVAHPVGRSLALLAVGPEGVALMESGRVPSTVSGVSSGSAPRTRRAQYNCHHVIPKSLAMPGGGKVLNAPSNFVIAKTTRRGRDQSQNPHHCWHALLLHPQTQNAPARPIPIYVVRPLFPFYPPLTKGYRTAEELRGRLNALGAPPLPEIWEKRILEFSRAAKHKAYEVPREFQDITRSFGDLYQAKNKDPLVNEPAREALAEQAAARAAQWLPAGAYINGRELPPSHRPKKTLPIIDSQNTTAPETESPTQTSVQQKRTPKRTKIKVTNETKLCP
jgi:hypothetical protein